MAGSVAAYAFSAVLALISPIYPLTEAAGSGLKLQTVLLSVALLPLSALAATALGALTSRAVMPSTGTSIIVLLGVCAGNLILDMGPLRVLTVPMINGCAPPHPARPTSPTSSPEWRCERSPGQPSPAPCTPGYAAPRP